jgi:hypothetical protein
MPYPESCPECGGAFRNTGTHYTARRNEVGRHVLLELGCQNTSRRYWWDFTSGTSAEDSATPGRRASLAANASQPANGSAHNASNGHTGLATLEAPTAVISSSTGHSVDAPLTLSTADSPPRRSPIEPSMSTPTIDPVRGFEPVTARANDTDHTPAPDLAPVTPPADTVAKQTESAVPQQAAEPRVLEASVVPPNGPAGMKDAFVRQLQLDRLTLRQMRSWLMAEDARRAIEVAAGATEATYERLALILFGVDLPQLLGKQPTPPPNPGMSAEERLELQREKARIRARLRRAAAKAARQP